MASTRRLLVVTPTYNERDNLQPFIHMVFAVVPHANVLVVDDASPDGTGKIADQIAAADPRVQVKNRPGKLGIGSAYLDGFAYALEQGYDVVVQMDTDLSHDAQHLPAMLDALDGGADLVLGSRNVPGGGVTGWGPGRHFLSKGGSLYSRTILGLGIRDLTSGYKVWGAEALRTIDLHAVRSEGYSFQIETTWRAIRRGLRVVEVPIWFVDRREGKSKMSRQIFREAVLVVWKLRFDALRGQKR